MADDLYRVLQFFPDESYEYLRGGHDALGQYHDPLPTAEAVAFAAELIQRPAAKIGVIARVMIEDQDGYAVFDWQFGKGIVFPTKEECEAAIASPAL